MAELNTTTVLDSVNCINLGDKNLQFLKRVYDDGLDKYIKRLEMIDFQGKDKVLDFGSGYGQWSFALSQLNHNIFSFEVCPTRMRVAREIQNNVKVENIKFTNSEKEYLSIKDNTFDLVFCYSVIFLTGDLYQRYIKLMHSKLKPGGMLYLNANGLGWYLYNIIETHNDSFGFSSRDNAISAIENTINGVKKPIEGEFIIDKKHLIKFLEDTGFLIEDVKPEGHICINKNIKYPFFTPSTYMGKEMIYEILAKKK